MDSKLPLLVACFSLLTNRNDSARSPSPRSGLCAIVLNSITGLHTLPRHPLLSPSLFLFRRKSTGSLMLCSSSSENEDLYSPSVLCPIREAFWEVAELRLVFEETNLVREGDSCLRMARNEVATNDVSKSPNYR